MQDAFEEMRQQIQDIRKVVNLRLSSLELQVTQMRVLMDEQFGGIDSRLAAHTAKFKEQRLKTSGVAERLERLELAFSTLLGPVRTEPLPLQDDEKSPEILPPQISNP